ncbi:MAG: TIGR03905 family TSCPD domain-containing protein [Ruminococcus sp.]|jgi:uncharacterized protein (TIGR03905 family)|nr:TIGR03905 family TSCPD domain-containing protein [Ruminococcus sp.]
MRYNYQTENTCASQIAFDYNDGIVTNVVFTGGCNGNLKAIPKLIDGWTADLIIEKVAGTTCGRRPTSCSDQLAKALMAVKEREAANKTDEALKTSN